MTKYCKYFKPEMKNLHEFILCFYELDGCCTGGPLHIVTDDFNIDDNDIMFCLKHCLQEKDLVVSEMGRIICEGMLRLSDAERRMLVSWDPYGHNPFDFGECIFFDGKDCDCEKCDIDCGWHWDREVTEDD